MIKLTATVTTMIIIIVIIITIMKAIATIKVVQIIKLMASCCQQPEEETVLIPGDSTTKKLNGFLLTQNMNHMCVVKIRPINSAKVRCMHNHAKPTVRDFNMGHILIL